MLGSPPILNFQRTERQGEGQNLPDGKAAPPAENPRQAEA